MTAPPARPPSALTVLVIAKEPVAGRVKTRLTPPFTPQEAAELAAAALADTLDVVAALPVARRVLVLDGRPGPWLPAGFEIRRQGPGTLDERIAAAFARCEGPALLLGMDTPQVTPGHLAPLLAADAWQRCGAWLGPAADGGFWCLGLRDPDPALVRGVPMSTPRTGAAQHSRLVAAGLTVGTLPVLRDVDVAEDAREVAAASAELGGRRFAATHAGLCRAGAR